MESYFTFPDGGLSYDCPTCRQRCCRGKGFALGAEELVPLLARRPGLAAHIGLRAGGAFAAVDLTDGCWFLAGDGNCAIEVEDGRASKPSTCRLFPFNRVFRAGEVRVIDVNSVLCPVEAAGGNGVRWAELTREIDELAGSPLVDTPAPSPPELAADWLRVERRASEAAREHASSPRALAGAMGDREIDAHAGAWARLYGVDPSEQAALEAELAPRVALISPSLRWNALFRKDAAPYPRAVERLPARLRALTFLGALAMRSLGALPSLRGLTELWQAQAGALEVLERWGQPVALAAPGFDADLPTHLHAALGRMMAGAFRGRRALGELVEEAAAALPPVERPLAIALAASQLSTLMGAS